MSVPSLPFPHTGVATGATGHRHVLIPYAAMAATDWVHQGAPLALPHLDALLARMVPAHALQGEDSDLTPPHERMAALWRGWADLAATRTAALPWAALAASTHPLCAGGEGATDAWAFMTPCHWTAGADQIRLDNPCHLQLQEAESRQLLALLQPWFAEDGFQLHYLQPDRWLVRSPALVGLQTAALDRVLLRDVSRWGPDKSENRTLQRLHSEVQMLLYTHPFNDARTERGLPPVNAFWLHAAGALPASCGPVADAAPEVWEHLRVPAMLGNTATWLDAWAALDAGPMAELLRHVQAGGHATLALSGEHSARSFVSAPRGLGLRIRNLLSPQRFSSVREVL